MVGATYSWRVISLKEEATLTELRPGITALVAAHPARLRNGFLVEALASIAQQTLQPDTIIVVNDLERAGAGRTRQKLLRMVETTHLAWLDSDDVWYPQHLEKLWRCMQETDAVYAYSWFNGIGDPLGHFGKPFDPCNPHHTTITALVRTDIAQEVGFPESSTDGSFSNEDWFNISGIAALCCERGLKITHLAEKTWLYRQGTNNSSGLVGRGDAV